MPTATLFVLEISVEGAAIGRTVLGEGTTVIGVDARGRLISDAEAHQAVAVFAAREGEFWARSAGPESPAWIAGERLPAVWARIAGTWVLQVGAATVHVRRIERAGNGPTAAAPGAAAGPMARPSAPPPAMMSQGMSRPSAPPPAMMSQGMNRPSAPPPAMNRPSMPPPAGMTQPSAPPPAMMASADDGPATVRGSREAIPSVCDEDEPPASASTRVQPMLSPERPMGPSIRRTSSIPSPLPGAGRPPAMAIDVKASDLELAGPGRRSSMPPAASKDDTMLLTPGGTAALAQPYAAIHASTVAQARLPLPSTPETPDPTCGATRVFAPEAFQQAHAARSSTAMEGATPTALASSGMSDVLREDLGSAPGYARTAPPATMRVPPTTAKKGFPMWAKAAIVGVPAVLGLFVAMRLRGPQDAGSVAQAQAQVQATPQAPQAGAAATDANRATTSAKPAVARVANAGADARGVASAENGARADLTAALTAPSAIPGAVPGEAAPSEVLSLAPLAPADLPTDPVAERRVAEAVFAGDYLKALDECGNLAANHPSSPRYGVMVRVLRAKAARIRR